MTRDIAREIEKDYLGEEPAGGRKVPAEGDKNALLAGGATPGSDNAIEHGCTCPVLDNSHGRGHMGNSDVFVINGACPLHGDFPEAEDDGEECHDCGHRRARSASDE